jgi:hypothetical protein
MPDNDDARDSHDDFETRLRKLEAHATEFATIKTLLAALFAITIGGVGTGAVIVITDHSRIEAIERDAHEHQGAQFHRGAESSLGDLRSDLRVIRVQLEAQAVTTQEIRERVTRIEDAGRRPR